MVQEIADAPSGKRVVVQTDANATDNRFPVLIADKEDYTDVEVSVKGKAISGKVDQGIGLVFRFRDPQSYYVVRANALENNVRLYKVVNGHRKQIAGADVKVTSGQWHTLRVVARGNHSFAILTVKSSSMSRMPLISMAKSACGPRLTASPPSMI